jgi:carboxymethylenebutenolidase
MGETIELKSADGHRLSAYRSAPTAAEGGVVVIQEVFGVNAHICRVADGFAEAGFIALAPALFDRIRPGVELDYTEEGVAEGRDLAARIGWDNPLTDLAAAVDALKRYGKVATVGYCWGGSVSYLCGCRLPVDCFAVYYGRHIVDFLPVTPKAPGVMHFGAEDSLIPPENVEKIRAACPDIPIYVYEGAGHGFNCDARADFRPAAAKLALKRTLNVFDAQLRRR